MLLKQFEQFVSEKPPVHGLSSIYLQLQLSPAKNATGIEGISCALLRRGIKEFALSIAKLINLSLSAGTVPCHWKRVRVSALFKAGDMNEVIN